MPPVRIVYTGQGADNDLDARLGAFTPVFNVKDPRFGAKGDGVTDDTAAIQKAIDKAAGVGVVVIPAGTYLVSDVLLIPSGTILVGEGRNTLLKRKVGSLIAGQASNLLKNANYSNTLAAQDTNIIVRNLRLSMNSEGGNVRPSSSRNYATVSFGGVDGLWLSDLWFEESLHFTANISMCDNAHVRHIDIRAQYASTPVGNVDGVHFTNCRDFSLIDAVVHSGDDMVGVTTDLGGRASYRGVIRDVRGSSKEANGVIFGPESTGGFDLTDMIVSGVRFRSIATSPSGAAVRFKGNPAGGGATVTCGRSVVSDVVADTCGYALDLQTATEVTARNVRARSAASHAVLVQNSSDCTLGGVQVNDCGSVASPDSHGVQITGSSRIAIAGANVLAAGRWGCQIVNSTDISVDDLIAYGCGRYWTTDAFRGGIRVQASTRVAIGVGCRARDDGSGSTNYGLYLSGACTDVAVHGSPEHYGGAVKQVANSATGVDFALFPGQVLAQVTFAPTAGAANYNAATARRIASVAQAGTDGDYNLTLGFTPKSNDHLIVTGSANQGIAAKNLCVAPVSIAGVTVRVMVTDTANARVLPSKCYVQVAGAVGSVP